MLIVSPPNHEQYALSVALRSETEQGPVGSITCGVSSAADELAVEDDRSGPLFALQCCCWYPLLGMSIAAYPECIREDVA